MTCYVFILISICNLIIVFVNAQDIETNKGKQIIVLLISSLSILFISLLM